MTDLSYAQAILLGVIQGITEFLPISSSAHLALSQKWMGLDPDGPSMLLFDAMSHVGTVVSIVIVFWASARQWLFRLFAEMSPGWTRPRYALRILNLGIVASIPTAVIGLAFKDWFESGFDRPKEIGIALMITGVLLVLTTLRSRGKRGWKQFRWWHAFIVGIAQGCSISPGISRSGATICAAVFCGLRRRWAGEFSFLLAVPAILGGAALKWMDTMGLPANEWTKIAWGPEILGAVVAMLVGIASLWLLLDMLRRARLHWFSVYCWALGIIVLMTS